MDTALQCTFAMEPARIIEGLTPFLESEVLSAEQLAQISGHLELLLKWNKVVNLTSIRSEDAIVSRHFGESLFAARKMRPLVSSMSSLFDLGSGAGFPGIPIKVWTPELRITLIESRQKKAAFLNEVIRTLHLVDIQVANGRAEDLRTQADAVTLRAVERFENMIAVAKDMVRPGGELALLIGSQQTSLARSLLTRFEWREPIEIPLSLSRVVLMGRAPR